MQQHAGMQLAAGSQTCSCRTRFTGCCPGIVTKLLHAAIAFMLLCWCGVQVPRVALTEMGPQLDCVLRRTRLPPVDLEKEALKQPKLTKKKVRRLERLSLFLKLWGPGAEGLAGRVNALHVCCLL